MKTIKNFTFFCLLAFIALAPTQALACDNDDGVAYRPCGRYYRYYYKRYTYLYPRYYYTEYPYSYYYSRYNTSNYPYGYYYHNIPSYRPYIYHRYVCPYVTYDEYD